MMNHAMNLNHISSMGDIYDPPPAPIPFNAPPEPRLSLSSSDMLFLGGLALGVLVASIVAGWFEPSLAILVGVGGSMVILESWFTAVGFLSRKNTRNLRRRAVIFLAALLPWLIGLGIAAILMNLMFYVSDRLL